MAMKTFLRLRFITLHTKTALLFSVGLVGIILSSLFITRHFFLYSLNELESIEIHRDSNQAQSVIQDLLVQQEKRSYDWAYWDETYQLLLNGDTQFAERNLYPDSLDTLGLDVLAFITESSQLVEYLCRDIEPGTNCSLVEQLIRSQGVSDHLIQMHHTLDEDKTSRSGLIRVENSVWVVSLTPVRNSEGTADVVGWMLWGQHLTRRFPSQYQNLLTAKNDIVVTDAPVILPVSHNQEGIERDQNNITHYTLLSDMTGQPIGYLKTSAQRLYYQKGNETFYYLILTIIIAAGFVAVATFALFRSKVAKRFENFERGINQLIEESAFSSQSSDKQDEFERITELVRSLAASSSLAEDRLKETLQKFDALYQSQNLGMLLVVDRFIVDVNQALLDMLSYSRDELVGKVLDEFCIIQNDVVCSSELLYQNIEQGMREFEGHVVTKGQQRLECLIEATLIEQRGHRSIMLSITDISEQKQQEQLIYDLTHCDPVSGLLNRPTMMSQVQPLIDNPIECGGFSVLYLRVKRLKEISEVYGHSAYDMAVKHFSATLRNRFNTSIMGRISEYEFMVCELGNGATSFLIHRGTKLIDSYKRKTDIGGLELDLSVEGAVIDSQLPIDSFETLVQSGFYAIQQTEKAGASLVVSVTQELFVHAQKSLAINRDLISAVKEDGHIIAYYQPIVRADSAEIIGFEALARWEHPQLGMVSPAVFIPLAEQRKVIIELGEQILGQACQFINELQTRSQFSLGKRLSIHVNLSSPHFYSKKLVGYLSVLIEKYQIEPGQLVLELTESMLLGAEEETIKRMDAIKKLGIQLALDDFGTGYSSFSTLCDFPLDIVKLDQSYISTLESNDKAKTLVRSIINMSQELGLTTVAEGVETASQLRKLKVWNIDEIQGFYFYKPMSKQEVFDNLLGGKDMR